MKAAALSRTGTKKLWCARLRQQGDTRMAWTDLKKGDTGRRVRLVQEWLTLRGEGVIIDERFGDATEFATALFQELAGLAVTGVVTRETWWRLCEPYTRAIRPLPPDDRTLSELLLAYAEQHLASRAREVGGQNLGPWVRLYMNDVDGPDRYWCAGFAWFCLNQAAQSIGVPPPIARAESVPRLVAFARAAGLFVEAPPLAERTSVIRPGDLFVERGGNFGWKHIGIVKEVHEKVFVTIEGNSNDDHQDNSWEVCQRVRAYEYPTKDFISFRVA